MADKTIQTKITEEGELHITCDGQTFIIVPADFSAEIVAQAVLHGFKQKICDAGAIQKDDEGFSATPAQKLAAMRAVRDQLAEGDWNRRATGDGTAGMGLLVAALVRLTGQDRETVQETVDGWTKDQQSAMRASAEVAPVIATIKAERAARGDKEPVDTGSLLARLMPSKKAA